MIRLFRNSTFVLGAVVIFSSTYNFASSISGVVGAGHSTASISGWDVSNIRYDFASDPSKLNGIEFDLDDSADIVKISLRSSRKSFSDCENIFGTHWSCNLSPEVYVLEVDELSVIVVGK
jgi:hypothetical protein